LATYHAIAAVGQAVVGLLAETCPRPEFPGARFEVYQAANFRQPMEEGVALYVHRVGANPTRRNPPPRKTVDGRVFKQSLPLDVHFLVIPWSKSAARQHMMLGWLMRVLEDNASLGGGFINRFSAVSNTFQDSDSVEIVMDPISMQDMLAVWEVAKPNIQISASYVARFLPIDSEVLLPDPGPLVQSRTFVTGPRQ
jgi:hypothetical protein